MAKIVNMDPVVQIEFSGPHIHVRALWHCVGCSCYMQLNHVYANGTLCAHQWISKVEPYKFGYRLDLLHTDGSEKIKASKIHTCTNKGFKGTTKPISGKTAELLIIDDPVIKGEVVGPWKHYVQSEAKPITKQDVITALKKIHASGAESVSSKKIQTGTWDPSLKGWFYNGFFYTLDYVKNLAKKEKGLV